MNIISKTKSYLHSSKDIITIFSGDFISKGFTFFVNIILLKIASPEEFGFFAIYITYLGLGAQFADLGINQGMIKFFSVYKKDNIKKAESFITFSFRIKLVIAISLSLIYLLLSFPTVWLYKDERILLPLLVAAFGVFGQTLLEYIQSALQAKQKYNKLARIKVIEGFLKFGGLLLLVFIGFFRIEYLYWIYSTVTILVFLLGLKYSEMRKDKYNSREIGTEIYHFSKWIFLSSLVVMFMSRLDILMLSFLKSNDYAALGIYSAGLKLGIPLIVATGSMLTVFYPKAMEIRTISEIKSYIRRTLKTTIPLSILFLLFWFIIELAVPRYFPTYVLSLPVFRVLLFAYMFVLLGNPITVLLLTINKQKLALYINIIQLIINIILNLILYLFYDIVGIALGTMVTFLIGGIMSFGYLYIYVNKNKYLERIN